MKASTTIAAVAALAIAASAAAQTALDTKRIIATGLTYPTCNELSVLSSKVNNEHYIVLSGM